MAGIRYSGLTKTFEGGTLAVDHFDLEIADGELMVVVGPSGSGKTTVLRMTAGLEEISEGEILIGDRVVNDVPPRDRNIAMVFQNYALYPHMTVFNNMAFGLKLRGYTKSEIRDRVGHTAQMLGVADLVNRKPAQLSGGQRQRVAMGRAIVREPEAFLMDEPLSNLDAKLRVEMRAYIAMLHQKLRTTTVYVTHDQTEAITLGNRVAVMRAGRLEQCDVPGSLYRHPVNLFVAEFIGSPAMNLVRSRLTGKKGSLYAEFGKASLRLPGSLLESRTKLEHYAEKDVILGIRPEDIEDAAFVSTHDGESDIDAHVTLAEPMGSEVVVHFQAGVEPFSDTGVTESTEKEGAVDAEAFLQLVGNEHERGATLTARLNSHTAARAGEPIRLAIDTSRLYFFDPVSEEAI
jgi:multiple sugar transport system ATP-binding protein